MDELMLKIFIGALVLSLLPMSPFSAFELYFNDIPFLNILNWFVPISDFLVIIESWLIVVAIYYGIMWILNYVGVLKN